MDIKTIVENLNLEIMDKLTEDEQSAFDFYFWFETNGISDYVSVGRIPIWYSDNDDREYDYENDQYEDLSNYLKEQYNRMISLFSKIEFKT